MADDDKRLSFDREKAVFEQNCGQIRTLIQELHKKPIMSATVTGALVTAMSIFKTDERYTIGLLALIAVLNAFIAITCLRLRDVSESYIEKASRFSADFGAKGGRPAAPRAARWRRSSPSRPQQVEGGEGGLRPARLGQ
jgi:hypothetical protein